MSDQTDIRRPVSASKALVEGEYPFTQEDFRNIAAMLHADAGIALPDSKATLAYSRLAKRLRALGLKTFKDYCALVASQAGVEERQKMLASLTTNVTRFFREPHHFEHLRRKVVEQLGVVATGQLVPRGTQCRLRGAHGVMVWRDGRADRRPALRAAPHVGRPRAPCARARAPPAAAGAAAQSHRTRY